MTLFSSAISLGEDGSKHSDQIPSIQLDTTYPPQVLLHITKLVFKNDYFSIHFSFQVDLRLLLNVRRNMVLHQIAAAKSSRNHEPDKRSEKRIRFEDSKKFTPLLFLKFRRMLSIGALYNAQDRTT